MTDQEHATADAITEMVLVEMGHTPRTDLSLPGGLQQFTRPLQNGWNQMAQPALNGANQSVHNLSQQAAGFVNQVQQVAVNPQKLLPYKTRVQPAQQSWWNLPGSAVR